MFVIGRPDYAPVVGQCQRHCRAGRACSAATASWRSARATRPTWSEARHGAVAGRAGSPARCRCGCAAHGWRHRHPLAAAVAPAGQADELRAIGEIGLVPRHQLLPALVGSVRAGHAGLGRAGRGRPHHRHRRPSGASASRTSPRWWQRLGERGVPGMVEVRARRRAPGAGAGAAAHGRRRRPAALATGRSASRAGGPRRRHDATLRYGPLAAVPAAAARNRHPGPRAGGHDRPRCHRPGIGAEHRVRPDHHRPRRQRLRRPRPGLVPELPGPAVAQSGASSTCCRSPSWTAVTCCITLSSWSTAAR